MSIRYTFFCQITTFIKVCAFFVFELQTLESIDFSKIYELKGPKPRNKGQSNFYECCDLTKKVYLMYTFISSLERCEPGSTAHTYFTSIGFTQTP